MISHEKACIFIHIPKCGGGSVENLIWGWPRRTSDLWMGFISEYHNKYQTGGLQHLLGTQIRQECGAGIFDAYFKFAIVRNPWDRLYSQYHYMKKRADLREYIGMDERDSFKKYLSLIQKKIHVQWEHQCRFICDDNGELLVDFLGRFENFEDDVGKILKRLSMEVSEIPRVNKTEHAPYHEGYDAEDIELAGSLYADDIRLLGYSFGKN
ncbi:MAG: sulfotransferase family 2 domain-containing protein [Gammaproteobacteria bacterium]|nr:sulfotransferase family 2 domain-containing protein [Gammaproteobacteria bacterium]